MSTPARTSAPGWLVVARREIAMKMRDKSLLVSMVIMLTIAVAAFVIPTLFSADKDAVRVAVADQSAATLVDQAGKEGTDARYEKHTAESAAQVRDQVERGDADLGLLRTGKDWTILAHGQERHADATTLSTVVQQHALTENARAAGVKLEDLAAHTVPAVEVLGEKQNDNGAVYLATFAFAMLFYITSMFLGNSMAMSVVEEKQNRIVEVIASAVRVRDLLIGKVIGGTVVALAQVLLLGSVAIAGLALTGKGELLRAMAPAIGWFIPFFLVGVAVLATLFVAAGALCSRTEDVQSATMPVTMLSMFAFFGGIFAHGALAKTLMYIPLVSSIVVPGQLAGGGLAWWVPVASLLISLAFAGLMIWIADRIYRFALLRVGRRTSWKEALSGQR